MCAPGSETADEDASLADNNFVRLGLVIPPDVGRVRCCYGMGLSYRGRADEKYVGGLGAAAVRRRRARLCWGVGLRHPTIDPTVDDRADEHDDPAVDDRAGEHDHRAVDNRAGEHDHRAVDDRADEHDHPTVDHRADEHDHRAVDHCADEHDRPAVNHCADEHDHDDCSVVGRNRGWV
jgi:hypothetical protein